MDDKIDSLIEVNVGLDLWDQRDKGVILVIVFDFLELAAEIVVLVENRNLFADRGD